MLGLFIGRGFYLQQNRRKQERTEALQSSLCSHRGTAPSLHQNLHKVSAVLEQTTPHREHCQQLAVSWSPSQPLRLERGEKVSRFQSVAGWRSVHSWDVGELQLWEKGGQVGWSFGGAWPGGWKQLVCEVHPSPNHCRFYGAGVGWMSGRCLDAHTHGGPTK